MTSAPSPQPPERKPLLRIAIGRLRLELFSPFAVIVFFAACIAVAWLAFNLVLSLDLRIGFDPTADTSGTEASRNDKFF